MAGDQIAGPALSIAATKKAGLRPVDWIKSGPQADSPQKSSQAAKIWGRCNTLEKALRYRRNGTAEVYIFSIKTRQVFRYSEEHTIVLNENEELRPVQIPGFAVRISELFGMI